MKTKIFLKNILLTSTMLFCTFYINAQGWEKTYGDIDDDNAQFCQQTVDGGYIITGTTRNYETISGDVYLIKTDIHGDTLWTNTYGWNNCQYGHCVQQTNDLGYIIIGSSVSNESSSDIYLIKTDALGNVIWESIIGGEEYDIGYSGVQTNDGGYIITGYSKSFGDFGGDIFLLKTNENGDSLWTKTWGSAGVWDCGRCVKQTSDNGYIISGMVQGYQYDGPDAYLIKTDENGELLWSNNYNNDGSEWGYSVLQTDDGGYIVAGDIIVSGNWDAYLIKTDETGNLLWTRTFGGNNNERAYSINHSEAGGYIIAGYTESFGSGLRDVYLIKTDENGNLEWEKTFGGTGNDLGYSVIQTYDKGYVIAGKTESFGAGNDDVYLIKTDSLGNISTKIEDNVYNNVNVAVFPNPFNDYASIVISGNIENQHYSFIMFDLTGKEVKRIENIKDNYITLKRGDLHKGIYFFKLSTKKGIVKTGKIIIN